MVLVPRMRDAVPLSYPGGEKMGILERFTGMIKAPEKKPSAALTYRVVLGALLSLVSRADGQVTEHELRAKKEILNQRGFSNPSEQQEILEASHQALAERLDWEGFTREVNQACEYPERVRMVRDLFFVAWADHDLANAEIETIRKISNLLWVEHKDFIQAKLETKPNTPSR